MVTYPASMEGKVHQQIHIREYLAGVRWKFPKSAANTPSPSTVAVFIARAVKCLNFYKNKKLFYRKDSARWRSLRRSRSFKVIDWLIDIRLLWKAVRTQLYMYMGDNTYIWGRK